jgi:hypothetical protein
MQVSLIASSNRPNLYPAFFKSLEGTTVEYEVVFAGDKLPPPEFHNPPLKYILTGPIKPSQCYEIARRHATGEVVCWVADDCLFPDDVLGKAYRFWKSLNDEKVILSLITRERYDKDYFLTDLNNHTLKGPGTPLMAPIAMMSRDYLNQLGGFDQRYTCGQSENDIVMRIYADGGSLVQFKEAPVVIDHFIGHGGVTTEEGYKRPFAQGYPHDRQILEGSWIRHGVALKERRDEFVPYPKEISLTESHGPKGMWE